MGKDVPCRGLYDPGEKVAAQRPGTRPSRPANAGGPYWSPGSSPRAWIWRTGSLRLRGNPSGNGSGSPGRTGSSGPGSPRLGRGPRGSGRSWPRGPAARWPLGRYGGIPGETGSASARPRPPLSRVTSAQETPLRHPRELDRGDHAHEGAPGRIGAREGWLPRQGRREGEQRARPDLKPRVFHGNRNGTIGPRGERLEQSAGYFSSP